MDKLFIFPTICMVNPDKVCLQSAIHQQRPAERHTYRAQYARHKNASAESLIHNKARLIEKI